MPETEFSRKFKALRKQSGLKQREVAEKCQPLGLSISPSMISHLETGNRDPSSLKQVQILAKALDGTQSETTQLLMAAGFTPTEQPGLDSVPYELKKFLADLTDPDFISPLGERLIFPKLETIDDSLTEFLHAWRGHAVLRLDLRKRRWGDVLEEADRIHELIKSISARLTAWVVDAQGLAHYHRGQIAVAESLYQQSKFYARQSGDDRVFATCAVHLADLYKNTARLEEAKKEYEVARAIFEGLGEDIQVARVNRKLGTWFLFQGEWQAALPLLEESLKSFQRLQEKYESSYAHNSLGWAYSLKGKWDDAVEQRRRALELTEELNQEREDWEDKYSLLRCYLYLGDDLRQIGRLAEAREKLERARELAEKIEEEYEWGRILLCLAKVYHQMGQDYWDKALSFAEESRDFHFEKGNKIRYAQSLVHLGRLYADLNQNEEARDCYARAVELCDEKGVTNHYYKAAALVSLCDLYRKTGQYQEIEKPAKEADRICNGHYYYQHLARLKVLLAESVINNEKLHDEGVTFCEEAYQNAYRFNEYLADEIHEKVCRLVTKTRQTQGVAIGNAFGQQLYEDLTKRMGSSGWCLALDRRLREKFGEQVFEIGKITI